MGDYLEYEQLLVQTITTGCQPMYYSGSPRSLLLAMTLMCADSPPSPMTCHPLTCLLHLCIDLAVHIGMVDFSTTILEDMATAAMWRVADLT